MSDWSDEETHDPHDADRRNFYKGRKMDVCRLTLSVNKASQQQWFWRH
jgi:hypothetical protein